MKLSGLGVVLQLSGAHPGFFNLAKGAIEAQSLIEQIAYIAQVSSQDVKEFYQARNYSLEYIKYTVLLCGELDEGKMRAAAVARCLMRKYEPLET